MDRDLLIVRWATFFALVVVALAILFPRFQGEPTAWLGYGLIILISAALLTFAVESSLRYITRHIARLEKNPSSDREWLIRLNEELFSAQEPSQAILSVMRTGRALLGAAGASFTAFDEWDRSIPFLSDGELPIDRLENLVQLAATRQTCRRCIARNAATDCVLLDKSSMPSGSLICMPLHENGREIGLVNYFGVTPGATADLKLLATCAGFALDSLRHRDRELAALRHLQTSVVQRELPNLLSDLSEPLSATLGADATYFWFPDGLPGGLAAPTLLSKSECADRETPDGISLSTLSTIWQNLSTSQDSIAFESMEFEVYNARISLLAVPLTWRGGRPVGLLLLLNGQPLTLTDRQKVLVQTLASEAALIVQNSRLIVQVQYQAVLDERARLAREIHDGLAQTLAFLKIQASQMKNYLAQGRLDRLEEALATNYQTLTEAYKDARQSIDNLRRFPDSGTNEWLMRIIQDFEATSGLRVDVTMPSAGYELPLTAQVQLIRIVQEALNNIRKHAQASLVALVIEQCDEGLIFEIRDDGLGFDASRLELSSHYGILGMRERAEMLGGRIEIDSHPGEGTFVRLVVPAEAQLTK